MIRIGIFLFTCLLLFASCEERRIAIDALPFKVTRGNEWGFLGRRDDQDDQRFCIPAFGGGERKVERAE